MSDNAVLTLISPQVNPAMQADIVQPVLARTGGGQVRWLVPGQVCVMESVREWPAELAALCEAQGVDVIYSKGLKTPFKLLISDMDSTMITVECIDELADFVGKKAEVSVITERAMNGELDFEAALTERVRLLKGLPEATLAQCYDERVRMMPGAKALVQGMRAAGAYCLLVSGGFTYFTRRVAEELGFHAERANVLLTENGVLTGEVQLPILGKEAKLAALQETCAALGIQPEEVLAVGDGANDLPMLLAAGMGVAYHAKPAVQAKAQHRINHCDLRALLWAQGLV